jgi:hypothetical protein
MHVRESLLRAYLAQMQTIASVSDCDMRAWLAIQRIESNCRIGHYSDHVLYYQRRLTPEAGHWTDSNDLQITASVLLGDFAMVERSEVSVNVQ